MSVDEAVAELERGALVAFPTETVYGLGADATNPEAMRALYALKGRPADHPVIAHIGSIEQLDSVGERIPDWARALARACWPGPLTLVVHRRADAVCDEVTGGRSTVGVRVPDHPVALELLTTFARPVAAPSANRFGRVSPTTADHVRADLGDEVAVVLDGGPSSVGVESTIVEATGERPRVLRSGGVTIERIEAITGLSVEVLDRGEVAAPGTLASHYSPRCRVEIVTSDTLAERVTTLSDAGTSVGVLAGAEVRATIPRGIPRVASPESVDAYARDLYAAFRRADDLGVDVLLVVPPAADGIGAAVVDRIRRAATVGT